MGWKEGTSRGPEGGQIPPSPNENWPCLQPILVDCAVPHLSAVAVTGRGMMPLGYCIKVISWACLIYQNKDTSFHLVLAQPSLHPYPKYLFAGRVALQNEAVKKC